MDFHRPILNIAFIPSVESRGASVEKKTSGHRLSANDMQHSECTRAGMTLIELGVVMSIVAILLALVLGLSRHVNAAVKLRRAQAELGEWHETLNAWYLKFGMYPDPSAPPFSVNIESNLVWLASTNSALNQRYYATLSDGTRCSFSSLASKPLKTTDPWGTPYFYQSSTNAYELLSCGPNAQHTYIDASGSSFILFPDTATAAASDPNTDDVYFEP